MKGIPLDPGNSDPIRIAVRIPAGMKERFEDYCRERGATMSDVVREMIEQQLASA